jgi:predicted nucleic acid-binding Zn ribbon protein
MDNTCVCCGAIIPEGRQICPMCEEIRKDIIGNEFRRNIQP